MYNIHNNLTGKISKTPNYIVMRIDKKQPIKITNVTVQGTEYQTCGILHSVGPRNRGHFCTDIKTANFGWMRMNDLDTHKIQAPNKTTTAYLIMLTKQPLLKVNQLITDTAEERKNEGQEEPEWSKVPKHKGRKLLSRTPGLKGLRNPDNSAQTSRMNAIVQFLNCLEIGKSKARQEQLSSNLTSQTQAITKPRENLQKYIKPAAPAQ